MEDEEIIISGPELTGPELFGSIAEYVIPKMKAQPKDFIMQVDCATGETITSHDFLQQALEITEGLIKFGLKADDVVIFIGSNNIRAHVVSMGILLSGGIFTPIDQGLRNFEMQYYFKEFKPKFVICEKEKGKQVQSCAKATNTVAKIILMDSTTPDGEFFCWEDIRTTVDVNSYIPRGVADPKKSICMINCSSGSTGMPKGVALSHYAILANFSTLQCMNIKEVNKAFLVTSPLFWISGTMLLLSSCYFGQTRYVPKSLVVEDILDGIQKCRPFFLFLSPPILLSLVRDENFKKYDVSSVKSVVAGGGPLSRTVADTVLEIWDGIKLSNSYGLTEASGGVTWSYDSENPCAIGKVAFGVKVKVVDMATGKSLGPNMTGEIRIKSDRLMNGYYNNEEATKSSFDEKGWLCTRDLVYYNEDHVFYFVSRVQEVIQYLTYKISPAELEAFIIGLPGVKDVAVVGVPHEVEFNHLRALVVKENTFDITAQYIIERVKENLSDRKHLRAGVQFVDALPRTAVGKLRRKELQKFMQ